MPPEIEQFKIFQLEAFDAVTDNRLAYYSGKIDRTAYVENRVKLAKDFYARVAKIISPSNTDISWIDKAAKRTLADEDKLVPPKTTGLTEDEQIKMCMLEAQHGKDFISQFVKINFNSLMGTDYYAHALEDGVSVMSEEYKQVEIDIKASYKKLF